MTAGLKKDGLKVLAVVPAALFGLASCASIDYVEDVVACDAVTIEEILASPHIFAGKPVRVVGYLSNTSGMPLVEFAYSQSDQARERISSDEGLLILATERGRFRQASQKIQAQTNSNGPFVLRGLFVNKPLTYQLSHLIADEAPYYLSEAAFETNC